MYNINLTPGEIIKKARKDGPNKLSQEAFGKEWGKSQSTVCKYEKNEAEPPGKLLIHCVNIMLHMNSSLLTHEAVSMSELERRIKRIFSGKKKGEARLRLMLLLDSFSN